MQPRRTLVVLAAAAPRVLGAAPARVAAPPERPHHAGVLVELELRPR